MAQSSATANPENLVVPLSAIIDQLQGKLTAADLNALLLAVVGKKQGDLRPGDLITADLINGIRADLADLRITVAALQAAGSTASVLNITRIDGPAPIRPGSRVTVVGTGFSVPAALNGIRVDTTPVTTLDTALSTATQLIFDMPDPGLSGTGRDVTLSVTNSLNQTDSLTLRLEPVLQIPTGTLSVVYVNPPAGGSLGDATNDLTYDFGYRLVADVDRSSSAQISLSAFSQAGWSRRLFAANGTEILAPIPLIRNAGSHIEVPFTVRLVVPAGTSSEVLDIGAYEVTAGTRVTPAPNQRVTLTRGQPIPAPEKRVVVSLLATSTRVQVLGGTAIFSRSTRGRLDFGFAFANLPTAPTQFTLAFTLETATSAGWVLENPSTSGISIGAQGAGDSSVGLTAPGSASATRLLLRITAAPAAQPAVDVTYLLSVQVP